MSHSRYVYVLTRGHLNLLQNLEINKYVKCNIVFEEDDVMTTFTPNDIAMSVL